VNAPLRTVFQKSFLKKLKIFSLGESVASVLNGFGVLASDETGHKPDLSTLLFPVNYYKDLAEAAVLAGARITHSNDVESRWSILTGKYMSGMRNAGPLCLSQYARQPDYHTFGMKEFIHTGKFYDDVCAASSFRRQNFNEIQLLHEVRDNEIHKKKVQLREQRAKEDFNESNICCGTKTAKEQTLKDPKKKKEEESESLSLEIRTISWMDHLDQSQVRNLWTNGNVQSLMQNLWSNLTQTILPLIYQFLVPIVMTGILERGRIVVVGVTLRMDLCQMLETNQLEGPNGSLKIQKTEPLWLLVLTLKKEGMICNCNSRMISRLSWRIQKRPSLLSLLSLARILLGEFLRRIPGWRRSILWLRSSA
jgi:hypothetical protein